MHIPNTFLRSFFAVSALVSASVWAHSEVPFNGLCGDYLIEGNAQIRFQSSGGLLSKNLQRAAKQKLPLNYTLQSLGFDSTTGVVQQASKIVSSFSVKGTAEQSSLPIEKLTSSSKSKPRILVLEQDRSLSDFFKSRYETENYSLAANRTSTIPGIHLIDRHFPNGDKPSVAETFDHVLAPHVWQTLSKEDRAIFIRDAFQLLRPGGTLRISLRVHDVDQIAPELNELMEEGGAKHLFGSLKTQVSTALGKQPYGMMVRVQKVAFEPSEPLADDIVAFAASAAGYDNLEPLSRSALQTLVVIRKPIPGMFTYWNY